MIGNLHFRWWKSTAVLWLSMAASMPLAAQEEWASIHGVVTEAGSGRALSYVQVYLKSGRRGSVTAQDGRYRIEKLKPGTYEVIFHLQGYAGISKKIEATAAGTELNVAMMPTLIELEEVLVSVNRSVDKAQEIGQAISVVTENEIKEKNISQAPEVLKEEPGVFVQKTNQGGGSPIIRGLKANKLLLLVDGIRLNNSTYRGGNFQYLNSVDTEIIQRMEVARGPISVLYGSDALGGSVNVITKVPQLNEQPAWRWQGDALGSVSTADRTAITQTSLGAANDRFGVLFSGSYKSYGDVTRGSSGGKTLMNRLENDSRVTRILNKKQFPLGYHTWDFTATSLLKVSDQQELRASYQANRQLSVPRYDSYEAGQDSIRDTDPQKRDLIFVHYRLSNGFSFFNVMNLTLSLHRQFEKRIRQRFGNVREERDQYETVTYGAQAQFNRIFGVTHSVVYGAELYFDQVDTRSSNLNTSTGVVSPRTTIFPDGSSFLNFGVYVHDDIAVSEKWKLSPGVRFSAFRLRAPFGSETGFGTLTQSPTAFTASVSSMYKLYDGVNFVTNIAQGFRAANMDDAVKLGAAKGDIFDVPNPDVRPEKSLSFDAGFKVASVRFRANVIGFYNRITDLLIREKATFNGLPYYVDGADTLSVYHRANAGRAYTVGFETDVHWVVAERTELYSNLAYTYGQDVSAGEPMTGIPPLNGVIGIRGKVQTLHLELFSRFAFEQKRLSTEDREEDLRIPEGGTPGWMTLNTRVGWSVNDRVKINVAAMNMLDQNYREHVSGYNAPGRNFVLSVQLNY